MRDALGAIKIGHTYDLPVRIRDIQYWVTRERRPAALVRAIEVPMGAMKRIEFRAFRLLKASRLSEVEEWFSATASVASRRLNEARRQIAAESPYLMEWQVHKRITRWRAHRLWGERKIGRTATR